MSPSSEISPCDPDQLATAPRSQIREELRFRSNGIATFWSSCGNISRREPALQIVLGDQIG
jgi:hypothetical protein